jgi:hypothetical protein
MKTSDRFRSRNGSSGTNLNHRTVYWAVILLLSVIHFASAPVAKAQGYLTATPATVNFGTVQLGQTDTVGIHLKNTGKSTLQIWSGSVSGSGYSVSQISLPVQVAAGQTVSVQVHFKPTRAGTASGQILVNSNAGDWKLSIPLIGVGGGLLETVPGAANFGSVPAGTRNTQTIQIVNATSQIVKISSVMANGSSFSASGIHLPMWLSSGRTATFVVAFQPASSANYSGSVTVRSNAPNSSLTIPLSGSGATGTRILSVTPASVAFGGVALHNSLVQQIELQNRGNSNLTISGERLTGTGYSASALSGLTLAPGQSTTVSVEFAPAQSGTFNGTLTIKSNAMNGGSVVVPLTGSGSTAVHSVSLSWQPSSSPGVMEYCVYRSTSAGGPFSKMGTTQLASFMDTSAVSKTEYFYEVTAVNTTNVESSPSNEVAVTLP